MSHTALPSKVHDYNSVTFDLLPWVVFRVLHLSIDSGDNVKESLVVNGQHTVSVLNQHVEGKHPNLINGIQLTSYMEKSLRRHPRRERHMLRIGKRMGKGRQGPAECRNRGHFLFLLQANG